MEGGSTRMGSRSSTRHGPAAVFQGPVRRWRKSWTKVSSSSSAAATLAASSRVLLYKWIPVPSSSAGKEELMEEATFKPVRYLPLSVLLARKNEKTQIVATETNVASKEELDAQEAMDTTEGHADEEEFQEGTIADKKEVEFPAHSVELYGGKVLEEPAQAEGSNLEPISMGINAQASDLASETKSTDPAQKAQQDKEVQEG